MPKIRKKKADVPDMQAIIRAIGEAAAAGQSNALEELATEHGVNAVLPFVLKATCTDPDPFEHSVAIPSGTPGMFTKIIAHLVPITKTTQARMQEEGIPLNPAADNEQEQIEFAWGVLNNVVHSFEPFSLPKEQGGAYQVQDNDKGRQLLVDVCYQLVVHWWAVANAATKKKWVAPKPEVPGEDPKNSRSSSDGSTKGGRAKPKLKSTSHSSDKGAKRTTASKT